MQLHGVKMNVVETAPNGVINEETIFTFSQSGCNVSARYSGGKIAKGYLIGVLNENELQFSYWQLRTNGILDQGQSNCEISIRADKKIELMERFMWSFSDETGVNIWREL